MGIVGVRVLMRVRADDTGAKRTIARPGEQLIGRFLQHVLQARALVRGRASRR